MRIMKRVGMMDCITCRIRLCIHTPSPDFRENNSRYRPVGAQLRGNDGALGLRLEATSLMVYENYETCWNDGLHHLHNTTV